MKPEKLKVDAVLFDLDGTILDSIGIYYQIIEIVLKKLDIPMPSIDEIRDAAKTGEFEWERVVPGKTRTEKECLKNKIRAIVDDIYPSLFAGHVQLIPNAKKVLEHISQKGIKMGIATSTPRQNMSVKLPSLVNSGVSELLEVIITADDAPRKKPAADPLLECSNRLGIPPEFCMYVGDARTDIQAGKAAGMKTVGVLTGFDHLEALNRENPDAVIDSIADLRGMLI